MNDAGSSSDSADRNRLRIATGLAVVAGSGLATRAAPDHLPTFVVQHVGDGLWAVMIYLLLALLRPRTGPIRLLCLAIAVCLAVECSQLYQAEWIRELRRNRVAALVLGHGFQWSDVVSYIVGTGIATLTDPLLQRRP